MRATYCFQIPIVVRPNLSALRGKTVATIDRVAETWDAEAGRKRRQLYHHYYHYKTLKLIAAIMRAFQEHQQYLFYSMVTQSMYLCIYLSEL